MPLEPSYQSIPCFGKRKSFTDKVKTECRTDISTDEIAKIVNVTSSAVILNCKAEKGRIIYEGKSTFFICYEDVEGAIKKCECGAEFAGEIKDESIEETCKVYPRAERGKAEVNLSGVKLSATGYTDVKICLSDTRYINALTKTDGLIVKEREKSVVKNFGQKTGSFSIEEEKEYSYKIEEVISHSVDVVVTKVQCGVNSIIVDGETYLTSVFLQSGEKKGIIKEFTTYPFRAEIECEDAMPSLFATASVSVKSFKTDIFVDEEKGISRETVSVALKTSGEAYSFETVAIAEDAFSLKSKLETEYAEINSYYVSEPVYSECEISGRIVMEDGYLTDGAVAIGTTGERAKVISAERTETGIKVVGEFSANALFSDVNGKVFERKTEMPFTTEIEVKECDGFDLSLTVKSADFKLISITEGECSAVIVFNVYAENSVQIKGVRSVKEAGEKPENDSAISVYIPMENEDLWSLAKRLNCDPEAVATLNPDLEFPLSGKERIVIYRQK